MKKRKKGRRFTISAVWQAPEPRAIEMELEDLTISIYRMKKDVLPIIGEGLWKRAPLDKRVRAQVGGEPKLGPFDMKLYLVTHLDHSNINLKKDER